MDKIPVIYILSSGRSGSTLLDMLLGLHPQIWTLGEAQLLPWEVRINKLPCGCGENIKDCAFWQPLITRIPLSDGDYPIDYFRERHTGGKALRWSQLPDILRRTPSEAKLNGVHEYGALNAQYFREVWQSVEEQSGGSLSWLVDASKDVYRLFWMQQSGHFDLRIIHLVKDPRAFVYSMTKRNLPHARKKNIRFSGRWLVENALFAYFCQDPELSGKTWLLRYEDLANGPRISVDALIEWLELPKDSRLDFRRQINHALAGNPMRWESTDIQLDQKWKHALPQSYADLTWAMTGHLARLFGYTQK
jgi:hypothetical protein